MKKRTNALGVVELGGAFWLYQMRSNAPAGEPEAGPFATRLEAEAERTRRTMKRPPEQFTKLGKRGPLVPRSPALARRGS